MRRKKLAMTVSCLGLTVCVLSQSAFISLAAEKVQQDSAVAGVSVALSGYINNGDVSSTEISDFLGVGGSLKSGIGAFAKEAEEAPVSLYENLAISKVTDYVNIRSDASTEAEVLGKIYDQCAATILETVEKEDGTWYYIKSGSVTGYIKAEFFVTGFEAEEFAKANAHMYTRVKEGGLRVRKEASLEAEVLTQLYEGETCTVLEDGGEFVKVRTDDGTEGYVYGEYVEIYIECDEAISLEEEQAMI